MSDSHLGLLRRVAAVRRKALSDVTSEAPAESSPERLANLTKAAARADAQLTAATGRRRRRERRRRDGETEETHASE